MSDRDGSHARLVGINHVALEVGDIEEALDFYGEIFDFDLRGRTTSGAFIDMGDQFIALAETDVAADRKDDHRHFGLVVDDLNAVESRLDELDVERVPTQGLEFRDPWGNRFQIVDYGEIQFTKPEHILNAMGLSELEKSDSALNELSEKGMAPD